MFETIHRLEEILVIFLFKNSDKNESVDEVNERNG